MALAIICDICGNQLKEEEDLEGFRVKRLVQVNGYDGWKYKKWEEIDMCPTCLEKLYKMCNEEKK